MWANAASTLSSRRDTRVRADPCGTTWRRAGDNARPRGSVLGFPSNRTGRRSRWPWSNSCASLRPACPVCHWSPSNMIGWSVTCCARAPMSRIPFSRLGDDRRRAPVPEPRDWARADGGHHRRRDAMGETLIGLVGSPEYYSRFGFVPGSQLGVSAPIPAWEPAFRRRSTRSSRRTRPRRPGNRGQAGNWSGPLGRWPPRLEVSRRIGHPRPAPPRPPGGHRSRDAGHPW